MLYVFCGNDVVKVRTDAFHFMLPFEERGVSTAHIDEESFAPGILEDALGAVSLFGDETLYLIDTPSGLPDMYEAVTDSLPALKESGNTFVVIEGALLAPEKKKFEKHAEKFVEIKGEAKERFNAFSMADALAGRDKKSFWLLLQEAKTAGLSAEEIIGTLWWQLKALRLAAVTRSSEEAGMKDFPYNKAKRALSKFKEGELDTKSRELLALYHDGHMGKIDIDIALEQWVLGF